MLKRMERWHTRTAVHMLGKSRTSMDSSLIIGRSPSASVKYFLGPNRFFADSSIDDC